MDNAVDQAEQFGCWTDPTSRLIYWDATPALLSGVDTSGKVADLGGGNGILKQWIPQAITIDCDHSKQPDIVDDVLTHVGDYDLIVIRYVLHYLDDDQVKALFHHLTSYHQGRLLVIQFVNENLAVKLRNSVNEIKHFRSEPQLIALMTGWAIHRRIALDYDCHPDFYRNRLGHPSPVGHPERILSLELIHA